MLALAARSFSLHDQRWFAELSGDHNPLHVDPVAARRSIFGQPVVHGVHALLWSIDAFLAHRPVGLERIAVTFRRPVLLDEIVETWLVRERSDVAEVHVRLGDSVLLAARLKFRPGQPIAPTTEPDDLAPERSLRPLPLQPGELVKGRAGRMPLHRSGDRISSAFPAVATALGAESVTSLTGLSRLVGMECPGLHSLFTGFDVYLEGGSFGGRLDWEVIRADDRTGAVRMSVSTGSLHGTVDAFVRPSPTTQPGSAALKSIVAHDEFAAIRALVIGGSRGLGELTAKIIAAGGGESVLTWHRGESDAQAVLDDIRAAGGRASSVPFDTADREPDQLFSVLAEVPPTHLFYFATPRISVRKTQVFDAEMYAGFSAVYVDGFVRLVEAILRDIRGELSVFYPSTVFIDEDRPEFVEYAAAKAAGEVVARTLDATRPELRVVVERLPRLSTDQTASIVAVPSEPPTDVMLRIVRAMAAR